MLFFFSLFLNNMVQTEVTLKSANFQNTAGSKILSTPSNKIQIRLVFCYFLFNKNKIIIKYNEHILFLLYSLSL
jgi:hypothetical protein